MVAFENYVEEIRRDEEEGKYVAWEKAYRDVMEKLGNAQRDSEEAFQKARCEPNLAVVCEGFWKKLELFLLCRFRSAPTPTMGRPESLASKGPFFRA
jgi:hypothetical protein